MGSKPWRTLSVLAALSAFMVGCNNGPQKDNTLGATHGFPPSGGGQAGQKAFPKADINAFAGPPKINLPPLNPQNQPAVQANTPPNNTPNPSFGPNPAANNNPFNPASMQPISPPNNQTFNSHTPPVNAPNNQPLNPKSLQPVSSPNQPLGGLPTTPPNGFATERTLPPPPNPPAMPDLFK